LVCTCFSPSNMSFDVSAEQIHKAVAGLGTNDELLVSTITKHTNEELQGVADIYAKKYKETLVHAIKGDTSGNYKDLLVALVLPRTEFQSEQIHAAVKGLGTDEKGLIDILAHISNQELDHVKGAYQAKHRKALAASVADDTSGNFQKALLSIIEGNRREAEVVDPLVLAEKLFRDLDSKDVDVKDSLIAFLTKTAFHNIHATDDAFRSRFGHSILEQILKLTQGDTQELLKALITKPEVYWAHRIHDSIKGAGTKDKVLIRAFALNDRHQLSKIGNEYVSRYGETLLKAIKGDTSGWYKATFVALLNFSGHY